MILHDHSRAAAGYTVSLSAPSTIRTALALRHAIWRNSDPGWAVHGLPEILYTDHGSDFINEHITQVCVDLHVRLVHSTGGRPQGRGKLERFFGSLTSELLPDLPGHLIAKDPVVDVVDTQSRGEHNTRYRNLRVAFGSDNGPQWDV